MLNDAQVWLKVTEDTVSVCKIMRAEIGAQYVLQATAIYWASLRKTRENLASPQDLLRAGWQASKSTLHNHHAASFQRVFQTTRGELGWAAGPGWSTGHPMLRVEGAVEGPPFESPMLLIC